VGKIISQLPKLVQKQLRHEDTLRPYVSLSFDMLATGPNWIKSLGQWGQAQPDLQPSQCQVSTKC